jgi:hypothetical protein
MKKVLPITKFPHKIFGIIAVVMLIAFLFSLKPVAEIVKKLVEGVGIKFPPIEVFQETNNNIMYATAGALVLMIGLAAIYPVVKIALVVVGAAFVVYSAYKLLPKSWFGGNEIERGN